MAEVITKIILRNDTLANWESVNPILAVGEVAVVYFTDNTTRVKIGDGTRTFTDLPYLADYDGKITTLEAAIQAEVERATGIESGLRTDLTTETSERKAADETLQTNINSEASTRATKDAELQTKIEAEAAKRAEEDAKLQANINAEATTRAEEDAKLSKAISDEAIRATEAEKTISDNLTAEIKRAKEAEQANTTAIQLESERAIIKETSLESRIKDLEARGRFLSSWDATTGLPETYPDVPAGASYPYVYNYRAGDYYIVSVAGEIGNNYQPSGSSITKPSASEAWEIGKIAESREVGVGDYYNFDGNKWVLIQNATKTVKFANIAGAPRDNAALKGEFETIEATKQDNLSAGAGISATELASNKVAIDTDEVFILAGGSATTDY